MCEQTRAAALASCLLLCTDINTAQGASAGQETEDSFAVARRRPFLALCLVNLSICMQAKGHGAFH